jgi:hypothetical protein
VQIVLGEESSQAFPCGLATGSGLFFLSGKTCRELASTNGIESMA